MDKHTSKSELVAEFGKLAADAEEALRTTGDPLYRGIMERALRSIADLTSGPDAGRGSGRHGPTPPGSRPERLGAVLPTVMGKFRQRAVRAGYLRPEQAPARDGAQDEPRRRSFGGQS